LFHQTRIQRNPANFKEIKPLVIPGPLYPTEIRLFSDLYPTCIRPKSGLIRPNPGKSDQIRPRKKFPAKLPGTPQTLSHRGFKFAAAWTTAALISATALAGVTLEVSGTSGVAELARSDLPFNFQNGAPGVDGLPFRVENAYGPRGVLYDGAAAPVLASADGAISADYGGKFSVTVRWMKASGPAETVYADVTIANRLPEPILGYTLDLLTLRFPSPVADNDGNPNMRAYNSGGPGIFCANYGGPQPGALVCDLEGIDATEPLLMKLERGSAGDVEGVLQVMNHHDYSDGGSPYPWWPVPAGGSVHFRVGLQFAGPRPDPVAVCGDLFAAFARRYPVMKSVQDWSDRRPIAQVFFESDNTNGGRNPRKWFDAGQQIDVTKPGGVKRFQDMVFARARDALKRMKEMNAQGAITWDLEGAEFPDATYMGDPTKLATADPAKSVAPEMAEIADRYFKIYRDAGYRVGLTIRPQKVLLQRDASGRVIHAWENDDNWLGKTDPPADLQAFWQQQLEMKIRFARLRWGATLFYIDSNAASGGPLSFLVMRNLAAEFPDILLIPEHSTLGYYSACAPYRQLNMLSPDNITPPVVRRTYPGADGRSPCFSVINPTIESISSSWPQLVREVRAGDILFFRAWYDAPELPAIRQAYAEARK
jgi:hypothetical protein